MRPLVETKKEDYLLLGNKIKIRDAVIQADNTRRRVERKSLRANTDNDRLSGRNIVKAIVTEAARDSSVLRAVCFS